MAEEVVEFDMEGKKNEFIFKDKCIDFVGRIIINHKTELETVFMEK